MSNNDDEVEIYGAPAVLVGAMFAIAYALTAAAVFLTIHGIVVWIGQYYEVTTLAFMAIGAMAYIVLEFAWEFVDNWIFDNVARKVADRQKEKNK